MQRLQHLASFNQQLHLICGADGAGKTQLLTALAEQQTAHLVWLSCPKHASLQEIRRKILVQICGDSIFDDEQSLVHTLGRLRLSSSQRFHLLIDDADNLSPALWAELMVLSQLQVPKLQLAFSLTCQPSFVRHMLSQLTAEQQQQFLSIDIPALSQEERVALYHMLCCRCDELPKVSRQQVQSALAAQAGLPAEVVAWLNSQFMPKPKPRFSLAQGVLLLVAVSLSLAIVMGYVLLQQQTPKLMLPVTTFVHSEQQLTRLSAYAKQMLADHFAQSSRSTIAIPAPSESQLLVMANPAQTPMVLSADSAESSDSADAAPSKAPSELPASTVAAVASEVAATPPSTTPTPQDVVVTPKVIPEQGYTLQLASLKQSTSAESILRRLNTAEVAYIATDGQWLILLLGQFTTAEQAASFGEMLVSQYGIAKPWVRPWQKLQSMSVKALTGDEISQ
nr:AAA family ATPase [Shewanella sp. NIFS-20-20]